MKITPTHTSFVTSVVATRVLVGNNTKVLYYNLCHISQEYNFMKPNSSIMLGEVFEEF